MRQPSGIDAISGLDYTMLLCRDIEAMRAFYQTVMAFDLTRHIEGRYAEFTVGCSVLALRLRSRSYDGPSSLPESAAVHLAFRVPPAEVANAATQFVERGIEILEPVRELEDFGHRTLFVADPENNIIEIYAEI